MAGEGAIQTGQGLRYVAHEATTPDDMAHVLAFRARAFRGAGISDADRFDPLCRHFMVTERDSGAAVCVFRVLLLPDGGSIAQSYAAQFYDLTRLKAFKGAVMELGRFCLHPTGADPDILRLAWGLIASLVDRNQVGLLFGCSSFRGAEPAVHHAGLAALCRHKAPARWAPMPRATQTAPLPDGGADRGAHHLPPLLRTYLQMGGWVSDHAVIDEDLDTLHVFTGVEIAKIPAGRAKVLRMIAAQIA